MFILYLIGRNILLYTWNFQFILYILDTDIKFFLKTDLHHLTQWTSFFHDERGLTANL